MVIVKASREGVESIDLSLADYLHDPVISEMTSLGSRPQKARSAGGHCKEFLIPLILASLEMSAAKSAEFPRTLDGQPGGVASARSGTTLEHKSDATSFRKVSSNKSGSSTNRLESSFFSSWVLLRAMAPPLLVRFRFFRVMLLEE